MAEFGIQCKTCRLIAAVSVTADVYSICEKDSAAGLRALGAADRAALVDFFDKHKGHDAGPILIDVTPLAQA